MHGTRTRARIALAVIAIAAAIARGDTATSVQQTARTPDVNFVPTPLTVTGAMLDLAHVGKDDVVYDLGSGDGRIVIMAAEKYGARAVGVEIDRDLVALSRRRALERGVADRVTFIEADLFTADISAATVVTMYLSSEINRRLLPRLRRELKPGTRVVSHDFDIRGGLPTEKHRLAEGDEIFLWTVPRRPRREPDTPFIPTPQPVVEQMLQLARVRSSDVVCDLGSGDGRIVIVAAQRYGATGVGIEIEPALVERSRAIAREGGVEDRVTFIEADLFTADLSSATVVTLSLSAEVNTRLAARLRRELRPGARIVSRQFGLGDWTPAETIPAADGSTLRLWVVDRMP